MPTWFITFIVFFNATLFIEHGLSFEIAFDEDKKDGQRKTPPKKMESAENKQTKTTGADLQVKLDEAEIRRQQVKTKTL